MSETIRGVLYVCTSERDNPYDKHKRPDAHAIWLEAYRAVQLESSHGDSEFALKDGDPTKSEQCEFALVWRPYHQPFRLRANDVIYVEGRIGLVIRVTESAAVVLLKQATREFKTRFDKPVRFQPAPKIVRISANSEIEVLNRRLPRKRRDRRAA